MLYYNYCQCVSFKMFYNSIFFNNNSIPLCELINHHIQALARKFPTTKFLKSVSTTCIPNYPDKNLPTLFIYFEGEMKGQLAGPLTFGGMNLTQNGTIFFMMSVLLYLPHHDKS